MTKISILIENAQAEVNALRYYDYNGSKYFIFTRGEVDENNYEKLYAVKIVNINGILTATNIVDDNEWNLVKDTIKQIIKANKEGQKSVDDLDPNSLINLSVSESRIFKLNKQLADLLGMDVADAGGGMLSAEPVAPAEPAPVAPTAPALEPAPAPQQVDPYAGLGVAPAVAPMPTLSAEPAPMLTPEPAPTLSAAPAMPSLEPTLSAEPALSAAPAGMTAQEEADYKRLYEEEKERVQGLTVELIDLQEKLRSIKNLID